MPSKLVRRIKRKKRRNPDSGPSPSSSKALISMSEIGEYVLPGFAGFAAARFGTRVAATQIAKRRPSWGKHAGAAAAVSAFLAAWLLAHRVKALAKYQMPLIIGAGLAALQSIIQLYIPRLGWMVADATPELEASSLQNMQLPATGAGGQSLPAGLSPVDDNPADYVYNDSYDPGRIDQTQVAADQSAAQDATDNLDDIDIDEQQHMGIF